MADWILRAEGVNFADTVLNTNDLSTVRGSSLALEAFAHALEHEWIMEAHPGYAKIYHGGSQVAFRLEGIDRQQAENLAEDAREFLCKIHQFDALWPPYFDYTKDALYPPDNVRDSLNLKPPTEHMRFVVEIAEIQNGDIRKAINNALWRTRRRQMLAPNLPRAPGADAKTASIQDRAALQCPVDPAQTLDQSATKKASVIWVAKGQFRNVQKAKDERNTDKAFKIYASKRSADLRTYGRDARRMLYPVQLKRDQFEVLVKNGLFRSHDFAQSFHQIVANPPKGISESVKGKLAYLYFDGNGFSTIRANNDLGDFADAVEAVNRYVLNALLAEFLPSPVPDEDHKARMFSEGSVFVRSRENPNRHVGGNETRTLLRMETLFYGGEDFLVVLPAWLAWDFAAKILGWYAEGVKNHAGKMEMTHRCGMLICDQKTPVRRARDMAHALCEDAKEVYANKPAEPALAFHIIESHDVPEQTGDANEDIKRLRGGFYSGPEHADRDKVANAFRLLMATEPELRNAMHRLKSDMARSRLYQLISELDRNKEADPGELLRDYVIKGRTGFDADQLGKLLSAGKDPDTPMRLHLKVLADLWDYIDPFGEVES